MEGLEKLDHGLGGLLNDFYGNKTNSEYILKNTLPCDIRKKILAINNCVFSFGKYLDAFTFAKTAPTGKEKPGEVAFYYSLTRVSMKEDVEAFEVGKEELKEDEERKVEEINNLGLLARFILNPNENSQNEKKDKKGDISYPNFIQEINSIDEKVKQECAKIYTGELAKLITAQEKIPLSLIPFIQNLKNEMEVFRLKCVRELRTYCQNLYKISLKIPFTIFEFIYLFTSLTLNNEKGIILSKFEKTRKESEIERKRLNSKLGPYLANPYYMEELKNIELFETQRRSKITENIIQTQFTLFEREEKRAEEFMKRVLNNFEILTQLFDNFVFEEEFISIGDEEYFRERKDYNFLLKLKAENITSNLNLDSKRTFKKIYKGCDKTMLKVNYLETFKNIIRNFLQTQPEKIQALENEYKKENYSKNITAIKLQNNKSLFLQRNSYYEKYSQGFKSNLSEILNKYDKIRAEEIEYQKRWNEIIQDLRQNFK
jgi:hypothetical protein